jgi:hypothetical protein
MACYGPGLVRPSGVRLIRQAFARGVTCVDAAE